MAVLKADREYRRNIIFLYALTVLLGYALIRWGLPEFDAFLKQKKPAEALRILIFAIGAIFLSLLPWAICMLQYGRRILKTGQYPPAGAKVIRNAEIIEGAPARRKAVILIAGSLIIAALALFSALYFPYKILQVIPKK
jgi:hypothetical protein